MNTRLHLPTPQIGAFLPEHGGYFHGMLRIAGALWGEVTSPKAEGDIGGLPWLEKHVDVPGATSCFDGLGNTIAMAEAGSPLALAVRALRIHGFDDWYVPARDGLELMYRNLKPGAYKNACSWRDGDNASSEPPGYPYTADLPAQTSIAAFQEGGAEAFELATYLSSTPYSRYNASSSSTTATPTTTASPGRAPVRGLCADFSLGDSVIQ